MKEVKKIYFIEDNEERCAISDYSDGFVYELDDGTKVYTMSTDFIAHKVVKP